MSINSQISEMIRGISIRWNIIWQTKKKKPLTQATLVMRLKLHDCKSKEAIVKTLMPAMFR